MNMFKPGGDQKRAKTRLIIMSRNTSVAPCFLHMYIATQCLFVFLISADPVCCQCFIVVISSNSNNIKTDILYFVYRFVFQRIHIVNAVVLYIYFALCLHLVSNRNTLLSNVRQKKDGKKYLLLS